MYKNVIICKCNYIFEKGFIINTTKRRNDILKLVNSLDITPTMYKNAVDKYSALAKLLQSHGIECDIYPQGSFATGTVVRPINKDGYDLDVICELSKSKDNTSAKEVKESVGAIITNHEKYDKVTEYDKCWTIDYAKINDCSFSIDVVPAVDEDKNSKGILIKKSPSNKDLVKLSVAITKKTEETYRWSTSNPKGYTEWFNKINEPFKNHNRLNRRMQLFEMNRSIYNSVEDVPEMVERSALQIAIQILRRHRDVYFSNKRNGKNIRPASVLIRTIAAKIAETAPYYYDVFELLSYITKELSFYSELSTVNQIRFSQKYQNKNLISRHNGKWELPNPVNVEDNLIDSWNDDTEKALAFFKWLSVAISDFSVIDTEDDMNFLVMVENAFGRDFVKDSALFEGYNSDKSFVSPKTVSPAKPWRL